MKYCETESFTHKFAKKLLFDKLKEIDKLNDYCEFNGLKWRSNYGVFTELKFYETSNPYYFELSNCLLPHKGFDAQGNDLRGKDTLKWFNDGLDRGKILFVPDIVIFHKGVPNIFIEIVHTHPCEEKKLNAIKKFFEGHLIQVYEVSASEILDNTTEELKKCNFHECFTSNN